MTINYLCILNNYITQNIVVIFMNYHSDFADEIKLNKKEYKKQSKKYKKDVLATSIEILESNNQFNKQKGKYVSIDFKEMFDENQRKEISLALIDSLNKLYKIKDEDKVLIVGLGNQKIIADSLGPKVADKIMVTNHLYTLLKEEDLKRVGVFTPKVMGQTGLESADLVMAVSKLFKPDIIIVIDALATSSIKRINKVIQLSDTGISPGSGVGNYRKQIDYETLKIKVLAIGVATVVKASYLLKEEVDIDEDLILTPKEIDEEIEQLSTIIAESINKYIHSNYNGM